MRKYMYLSSISYSSSPPMKKVPNYRTREKLLFVELENDVLKFFKNSATHVHHLSFVETGEKGEGVADGRRDRGVR